MKQGITDKACEELAEAIEKHPSLKVLNLDGNPISDAGAQDFAKALRKNQVMEKLSLEETYVSEHGKQSVKNAIEKKNPWTPVLIQPLPDQQTVVKNHSKYQVMIRLINSIGDNRPLRLKVRKVYNYATNPPKSDPKGLEKYAFEQLVEELGTILQEGQKKLLETILQKDE